MGARGRRSPATITAAIRAATCENDGVIFLNNPTDASGSYWTYFNSWTAEDKKAALATLTTAKLMQHRVHVTTEETDGCSIATGNRMVKSLYFANEP